MNCPHWHIGNGVQRVSRTRALAHVPRSKSAILALTESHTRRWPTNPNPGAERLHSAAGVGAGEPLLLQSRHEHVKLLVQSWVMSVDGHPWLTITNMEKSLLVCRITCRVDER